MPDLKSQGTDLLEHVLQVSRRMAEHRSLAPLLAFAMDEILALVGAERGYIVLQGEDGSIDFRAGRDREGQDITARVDQISRSILQSVVASGKPLQVSNAMSDPRFGGALSVMELQLRSVMCVPLISHQRTIGAIYVENRSIRNRFRPEDIAPLALFANQAAVAIENAALNDSLNRAHKFLKELDELKSRFVILVSHELKTPLTTVNASAQLLKKLVERVENGADERIVRTGERLENAVWRMNKTLDEIIHVFSIAAGLLQLRKEAIALHRIVQETIDEMTPTCQERDLTVCAADLRRLPAIQGDGPQLRVVLANVIGNAIKFTPDGGQIQIEGRADGSGVALEVIDHGIGIPPAERERVFDLFHVLGNLTNHSSSKLAFQGGGLGLGLPIARAIIEAHGGEIDLDSPGRDEATCPGTTCRIWLPR